MTKPIIINKYDDVFEVTLNRPEKLNSFDDSIVEELHSAMEAARQGAVRLVIFKAAGKGFSGGFDLSNLDESSDGDFLLRFVRVEQLLQSIRHAPFATMALVHGPCYGAAADLVVTCQNRIATPDARFRFPGAMFGLILGTSRLAELVGADEARKLVLRQNSFKSDEALESGFLNGISSKDSWETEIEKMRLKITMVDTATYDLLSSRQTTDTGDADLATLIRSITSSSIKRRLQDYVRNKDK